MFNRIQFLNVNTNNKNSYQSHPYCEINKQPAVTSLFFTFSNCKQHLESFDNLQKPRGFWLFAPAKMEKVEVGDKLKMLVISF